MSRSPAEKGRRSAADQGRGKAFRRPVEDGRVDAYKELYELNKCRSLVGLKPLELKTRLCSNCGKEFKTIIGYNVETNCGCAKSPSKPEHY